VGLIVSFSLAQFSEILKIRDAAGSRDIQINRQEGAGSVADLRMAGAFFKNGQPVKSVNAGKFRQEMTWVFLR